MNVYMNFQFFGWDDNFVSNIYLPNFSKVFDLAVDEEQLTPVIFLKL